VAASTIGAVVVRYNALTFATKPSKLWLGPDGVPLRDGTTAVSLPTVELIDDGTRVDYDFEENPLEITDFRFIVRAVTLAAADTIAAGLRYDGGAITAGSGFDFCTLTITGQTSKSVIRQSEQRSRVSDIHDPEGKPVHQIVMRYQAQTLRTS
jgi:hypothetical protein